MHSYWFRAFVCLAVVRACGALLTGAHYLHPINCSSPTLYVPQGPYLFSHHWPFTSITIEYGQSVTRGVCYRDGALNFVLGNDKICSGIYFSGQAKLLCQYDDDHYCLIRMKAADGSQLTCAGSKVHSFSFVVALLLVVPIRGNQLA